MWYVTSLTISYAQCHRIQPLTGMLYDYVIYKQLWNNKGGQYMKE